MPDVRDLYDWSNILNHIHSNLACTCFHSDEDRRHLEQHLQLGRWCKSQSDWIGNIQRFVRPVGTPEHFDWVRTYQDKGMKKAKETRLERQNLGGVWISTCQSIVPAIPVYADVAPDSDSQEVVEVTLPGFRGILIEWEWVGFPYWFVEGAGC